MRRFFRKKQEKPLSSELPRNEYYETISARLGIFQVVLYLSLFAFVVLSFFKNTQLITYQNFYYFFKDLNASAESSFVDQADSISYPTSNEQSFALYRQGLVVAGNTSVTVFTASGRQSISQNINYQHPVAVGTGKYLLVYELGGLQYSLYNSYGQIFVGKSEYPITGAAVSDSGMYAIVSSSETYPSVVSLYRDNFSLVNRYNKVGYVMDVAINRNGTQLAILTSTPENAAFSTELMLCTPGEGEADANRNLGSSLGWRCSFTAEDQVIVLQDGGIAYFSEEGEELSSYSFSGSSLVAMDINRDGAALCLTSTEKLGEKFVIVFDKSGKILYNEDVDANVQQIARTGNILYWLGDSGIHRLNLKNGSISFSECNVSQRKLLAPNESQALVCSPQKADYVDFDS